MRRLMLVAILVLAAFVAALFAVLIGPPMSPGIDLGAYVQPTGGQSDIEAYTAFEQLGGDLNVTRHYQTNWTVLQFGGFIAWSAAQGNHPYISLHTRAETTGITWSEVAAGQQDPFLRAFADSMQGLGVPVWFAFHHEPENDPADGTAADFRAAAEHVYEVMAPECPACQIGVTFMRGTFDGAHGGIDAWLPDPAFFDFLGADLYTRDGTALAQLAEPSLARARELGKPYVIGEAGTTMKKKTWLTDARAFLKANEDIVMFDYSQTLFQGSDFRVNSGGGLRAWKAITSDPYFD